MKLPLKNPKISQAFGVNYDIYKAWGLQGHNGIDLCTYWGDKIYASESGIVAQVSSDRYGLGQNVRIIGEHYIIYGHLSKVNVRVGDNVKEGQVIGLEGNTGNVRSLWDGAKNDDPSKPFYIGTHLHFAIYNIGEKKKNSYQLYFGKIKRTINILNYNNGYHGAVDPYPFLYDTMLNLKGDKKTKRQYIFGSDGKGTWVYNPSILEWLHRKGIINKNKIEWTDIREKDIDSETIALIK